MHYTIDPLWGAISVVSIGTEVSTSTEDKMTDYYTTLASIGITLFSVTGFSLLYFGRKRKRTGEELLMALHKAFLGIDQNEMHNLTKPLDDKAKKIEGC